MTDSSKGSVPCRYGAFGIAVYDPTRDGSISDTIRRADKIMYENKRLEKEKGI